MIMGGLWPLVVVRRPLAAAIQLNGDIPFKVSCLLAPHLALRDEPTDEPLDEPPAKRSLGRRRLRARPGNLPQRTS